MNRYRLYTENKNARELKRLFDLHFPAYTVTKGTGVWKGKQERSVVFEVLTADEWAFYKMRVIAITIREGNKQEAVLVTREPVESFLFENDDTINFGKGK